MIYMLEMELKIEDTFIVTPAYVQRFRGVGSDYSQIARGNYQMGTSLIESIIYTSSNSYKQKMKNVYEITVNNGNTVYTPNN